MHVPAGERKQTGRAKENKFYSKKTFDETYYMITHSTHEMTEVLVLVPVLYQYQSNNEMVLFFSYIWSKLVCMYLLA